MNLAEKHRPKRFSDVIGQEKAIRSIGLLRKSGFGGRAILFTGKTGTGKTTLGRLIAAEFSSDWGTVELDAAGLTAAEIETLARKTWSKPIDGKGWAILVNEIQAFSKPVLTKLLTALESSTGNVVWIFTTTADNLEILKDKFPDFIPFIGRCNHIALSQKLGAESTAVYLRNIAQAEGLDGKPVESYKRLFNECRGSIREALTRIESGAMLD